MKKKTKNVKQYQVILELTYKTFAENKNQIKEWVKDEYPITFSKIKITRIK